MENDDAKRLGIYGYNGVVYAEYKDNGVSRAPTTLTTTTASAWYVLTWYVDDVQGLTVQVYRESDPSKRYSYTLGLASGEGWRLHAWSYSNTLYVDDYYEFLGGGAASKELLTFGYDALDRLTNVDQVTLGGYNADYVYNAIGNLMSKAEGGAAVTYTYTVSSTRPHAVTSLSNGASFSYDANGSMTQRVELSGTQRITYTQSWNADNLLTTVTNTVTGAVTKFSYDGDGARVKQTVQLGAVVTTTFYLGAVEIISGTPRITRTHYSAGGALIAIRELVTSTNKLYFVATDHLGSTSLVTCGNSACGTVGSVAARQYYYAYGSVRPGGVGNVPTDYGFTGQMLDDTGLMYFRARYYSSAIGRFVSADTIVPEPVNPQTLNRYSYVVGNPLRYTDPSGHCFTGTLDTVLCVTALVGLVVALSVVPGDSQHYDAPPGNAAAFTLGMAMAMPKLVFDLVIGSCSVAPASCQQTAQQAAAQVQTLNQSQISARLVNVSQQLGQSVWQTGLQTRGRAIESALGANLSSNFRTFDRFANGVATSIKSIDLAAKTYQDTAKLWNTVAGYVTQVMNFKYATGGGFTLASQMIASRELLLAISPNATQAQLATLLQLQAWAAQNNVLLTIVTVQ